MEDFERGVFMTVKSFFAGFGGQGIVSLGQIWVYLAMKQGKKVSFFPSYGAEKRGGHSQAGVVVSDEAISSPLVTCPDSALVMDSASLELGENSLKEGGILLVNSSLVKNQPRRKDIRVFAVDIQNIALRLGNIRFANMVALGAMARLTGAVVLKNIDTILTKFFPPEKHKFIPDNVKAIEAGWNAVDLSAAAV
jgi:2-oxoglutarate ferredoxin oxidoreductase subunit gamma